MNYSNEYSNSTTNILNDANEKKSWLNIIPFIVTGLLLIVIWCIFAGKQHQPVIEEEEDTEGFEEIDYEGMIGPDLSKCESRGVVEVFICSGTFLKILKSR